MAIIRLVAAVGVALAIHGLTDSVTLAVVILFAALGVFQGVMEPQPRDAAKAGRLPLPIPRHPWIALACGVIAAGAWAITHFALSGHGQAVGPAITYLALSYIWVLRSP